MESEALDQREAALAASHAAQQAELDGLLAKQEERLKAWEAGCAELEASIEEHRKDLAAEEKRQAKPAAHRLALMQDILCLAGDVTTDACLECVQHVPYV